MHYSLFSVSIYFIGLVTTSISSPYPPPIGGEKTLKCTRYSNITGPNTTCNDDPHQVCTGGCTGTIVASQCTKEGDPSDHSEQQMCTISYSQPSLERGVCINDQGTFSCQGIPQGEASESPESLEAYEESSRYSSHLHLHHIARQLVQDALSSPTGLMPALLKSLIAPMQTPFYPELRLHCLYRPQRYRQEAGSPSSAQAYSA
ncbi:uncharacterized protein PGTG_06554 [Puccinia graminis f. sp. tritici CRL 75-36-700-3]|uniref:Uncharacterized protein n=1 Tax=Puccinia graminis f. sp. tritici (strain CRL 75-36-700-3 / race SCCL) TaxID=418459 RepID=E3K8F8_PUCGT|nr:uncharacterized protein PGTG_06554 [Puccinia graminis f. sp. tritici CRL 75-36-700-3]EFP80598.2 hypothetical protein PGTG_06554 [Puccinia graminis f. sp. tritici CRL 75-36-700-3]